VGGGALRARDPGVRVLLTGGTGFLGRRVAARLVSEHAVRLLVRPGPARGGLAAGVEIAAGDVTDRDSLVAAMAGCDAVVHAAALVKIVAPRSEFERVNVGGLDNVLAAARQAGVGRIAYVSSFIALGPSERGPGGVLDETAEPLRAGRRWINEYERSKSLADAAARAAIARGAPLSVVYPAVIYGPGELTEGNIVVRHILDLAHGRLPALLGRPERRWSYAFVEDVADGVARGTEQCADLLRRRAVAREQDDTARALAREETRLFQRESATGQSDDDGFEHGAPRVVEIR